jgi:hypothetical protein
VRYAGDHTCLDLLFLLQTRCHLGERILKQPDLIPPLSARDGLFFIVFDTCAKRCERLRVAEMDDDADDHDDDEKENNLEIHHGGHDSAAAEQLIVKMLARRFFKLTDYILYKVQPERCEQDA